MSARRRLSAQCARAEVPWNGGTWRWRWWTLLRTSHHNLWTAALPEENVPLRLHLPAQNIASICSLLSTWGSLAGLGTAWPFPRALNFALALALDWVAIAVLRQRQRHLLSRTPLSLSAAAQLRQSFLQAGDLWGESIVRSLLLLGSHPQFQHLAIPTSSSLNSTLVTSCCCGGRWWDDEGGELLGGQLHHWRVLLLHLLLPNNTGWRRNGHVGDEHVDVVRLEVPQGSQGRSPWLSAVHQVRHGQAVQAGLLILLGLPARSIPSRGSPKAHGSVNSALVPARLVQTSQVSFQRLQLSLKGLPVCKGGWRGGDSGGGAREDPGRAFLVRGHRGWDHGQVDQVGVQHHLAVRQVRLHVRVRLELSDEHLNVIVKTVRAVQPETEQSKINKYDNF